MPENVPAEACTWTDPCYRNQCKFSRCQRRINDWLIVVILPGKRLICL